MCIALGKINKKLCACQFLSGRQTDTHHILFLNFKIRKISREQHKHMCSRIVSVLCTTSKSISVCCWSLCLAIRRLFVCECVCGVRVCSKPRARLYVCVCLHIWCDCTTCTHREHFVRCSEWNNFTIPLASWTRAVWVRANASSSVLFSP